MKLKNKKTGEIRDFIINKDKIQTASAIDCWEYTSLAELNEEWEDYEEPKEYWYIDLDGEVGDDMAFEDKTIKNMKEIGNYFETREEAEKDVEKLKAWTRLKDKGFRFTAWKNGIFLDGTIAGQVRYEFPIDNKDDIEKDLDLLFSQEDD